MSKYNISHSCGHTCTHDIVGANVRGERDRKADWLRGRVCPTCYGVQQREERAAKAKAEAEGVLQARAVVEAAIAQAIANAPAITEAQAAHIEKVRAMLMTKDDAWIKLNITDRAAGAADLSRAIFIKAMAIGV